MTNRRIVTHLAFVLIAAALVTEALAVSVVAAAGDSTAPLWTGNLPHNVQFALVAAYYNAGDYAAQLLDTLSQLTR